MTAPEASTKIHEQAEHLTFRLSLEPSPDVRATLTNREI